MKVNPFFLTLLHLAWESGIQPEKVIVNMKTREYEFIGSGKKTYQYWDLENKYIRILTDFLEKGLQDSDFYLRDDIAVTSVKATKKWISAEDVILID